MSYTRLNNKNFAAIGVKHGAPKLIEVEAKTSTLANDLAKNYFDEGTEFSIAPVPTMITVIAE